MNDVTTTNTTITTTNGDAVGVLLANVESGYWLLEGEEHLDDILAGGDSYPTPVRCIQFESQFHMQAMMPDGQSTKQLWGIHPGIIDRLKRRDQLVLVQAPELG